MDTYDIKVAVVNLLSNKKAYTVDEMFLHLKDTVDDLALIKPVLLVLHNEGFINVTSTAGSMCYSLREGKSVSDLVRSRKVRKPVFVEKVQPVVNPNGKISLLDGVDAAIWKTMADFKWRDVKTIKDILAEFGFDRRSVDRRMDTLIRSNRWFDRRNNGSTVEYQLRQGVSQLKVPAAETDTVNVVNVNATCAESHEAAVETAKNHVTDSPSVELGLTDSVRKQDSIEEGDTIEICIWKIMKDGLTYTSSDLVLLLEDYGFVRGTVAAALSKVCKEGFTSRTKVRRPGRIPFYAHTWVGGKPKAYTHGNAAKAKLPVNRSTTNDQSQCSPTDMSVSTLPKPAVAVPDKDKTALTVKAETVSKTEAEPGNITLTINFSGMTFKAHEFKELRDSLKLLRPLFEIPDTGLLQSSYSIKGVEFKLSELKELFRQIQDFTAIVLEQ